MNNIIENVYNWNPYFLKYDGKNKGCSLLPSIYYYEKRWYCDTNKIIHQSANDYINCKDCNSEADRKEYLSQEYNKK